jgi:lysophospholipase L1-like esterase
MSLLMISAIQAQPADLPVVVFLGDSITEAGAGPGGYVSLLDQALNGNGPGSLADGVAEAAKYRIVGAGISGHRVPDLQARLDRDVLVHKPRLVVIYIGINDVWHSQSGRGTSVDDYRAGLLDIIGRIRGTGSDVLLCTPSVIGEKASGSNTLDKMLDEYSAISREVAKEAGVHLFDLRAAFVRELVIRNPQDEAANILTTDGVHLNDAGNQFVADCMQPEIASILEGNTIRHVVLFAYKPTATVAEINKVSAAFAALADRIDTVKRFESGTNVSTEGLDDGLTHCYVLTFADIAGRDAYLVHPAHQEFVALAQPVIGKVIVADYRATDK